MTDGLGTIADAFAAVQAEAAPENTGGAAPVEPATEQAPASAPEQPDESSSPDSELQKVVDLMSEPDAADSTEGGMNWDDMVSISTVDGDQEVRLRDLRDGYMQRADYTKKTQALAEDRKRLDKAEAFMKAYTDDPTEFARAIAEETGWLQPGQRPAKEIDGVKLPTEEDFDAEVERRLDQRMDDSPEVQAGRAAEALRQINGEFDRIGTENGVEIPLEVRRSIMQEAQNRGVNDLELLFQARIARVRDRQRQTSDLRKIAPSRPGQAPLASTGDGSDPPPITNISEAWAAAVAEEATQ